MRLHSLHIKNFRMLEDFKVKKLGRVNLIVGSNNSGKSTVLEALRIYAGNANRKLLSDIAREHDEVAIDEYRDEYKNSIDKTQASEAFFTNRTFPQDETRNISIGDLENPQSCLEIKYGYRIEKEIIFYGFRHAPKIKKERVSQLGSTTERKYIFNENELHQKIKDAPQIKIENVLAIQKGEEIFYQIFLKNSSFLDKLPKATVNIACGYIPTSLIPAGELARAWDDIALTEYEDNLIQALQFIDKDIQGVTFVEEDIPISENNIMSTERKTSKRIAKIKLSSIPKPIPLKSMGDGVTRILQLALQIIQAKDGFLLIDEFENGLHYSVQKKVWEWVFNLAEELNIQVFATTHSWDCVESFTKVANDKKNSEGVLFRMGQSVLTSNYGQIIATEFDEEKLARLTQADIEIR